MQKLVITFHQIYLEPGASFRFSFALTRELLKRLSRKMLPSERLLAKFPKVTTFDFTLSASAKLKSATFKKGDLLKGGEIVEYMITLPYSSADKNRVRRAGTGLKHLVIGIDQFFSDFDMVLPTEWDASEIQKLVKENPEKYLYDIN